VPLSAVAHFGFRQKVEHKRWKIQQTAVLFLVLFIADAQIEWKENRMVITLHHKSVVTENPSIPDADWLREYAAQNTPMSNPMDILQDFVDTISDRKYTGILRATGHAWKL